MEPPARKAIELDPTVAGGYRALAAVAIRTPAGLLQAEELYAKSLSLDPNDAETLDAYSNFLLLTGRVTEALPLAQKALELEPFEPKINRNTALVLWVHGQDDAALAILRTIGAPAGLISRIQAAAGRFAEAADTLLSGPLGPPVPPEMRDEAVRLLRLAPATVASSGNLKRLGALEFVYLYVGAPAQVLEYYETNIEAGWVNVAHRFLSHPTFGPARRTERYKAYARKAGLVEYWRAKGWPEFCRPTTGDDFECN